MSEHPEVPPNCPFMSGGKVDNAEWFRVYGSSVRADIHLGDGHAMSLDKEDKDALAIIACVAAEYWMMASKLFRYSGDNYEDLHDPETGQIASPEKVKLHDKCEHMAHEWRVWGGLCK